MSTGSVLRPGELNREFVSVQVTSLGRSLTVLDIAFEPEKGAVMPKAWGWGPFTGFPPGLSSSLAEVPPHKAVLLADGETREFRLVLNVADSNWGSPSPGIFDDRVPFRAVVVMSDKKKYRSDIRELALKPFSTG